MNRWVTITNHVYQFLVFAYPSEFRRRYAAEMASVFEESCADAYRRGANALLTLCFATVYDLLVTIPAAHISRFVSNFSSDFRLLSKSPAFAAASGALAGNLFFVQEVVLGPRFGFHKTIQQRFILLAMASFNIAILWMASFFFSHLAARSDRKTRLALMQDRICAFRRLASIATFLTLCFTAKLLIAPNMFSIGLSRAVVPALCYWIAFPVLLLMTVLMVFLLPPLLILHSSESQERVANPQSIA